jgi:hypothetical protein
MMSLCSYPESYSQAVDSGDTFHIDVCSSEQHQNSMMQDGPLGNIQSPLSLKDLVETMLKPEPDRRGMGGVE